MIARQLNAPPRKTTVVETKNGTTNISVEAPRVSVDAPKVDVYPQVHVAPAQVQTIPAPKVEFSHKPCSWVFEIERDNEGSISRIIANPQ